MTTHLRPALISFALLTALCGVVYPAIVLIAGRFAPIAEVGVAVEDPRYFWSRPSAAKYDATSSAATNLGPTNPALHDAAAARVAALQAADPDNRALIPVDLVTSSASGLDPDISPEAAHYQAPRIARLRGRPIAQIQALVDAQTEGRTFGFLGEPRVNVVAINRALDKL